MASKKENYEVTVTAKSGEIIPIDKTKKEVESKLDKLRLPVKQNQNKPNIPAINKTNKPVISKSKYVVSGSGKPAKQKQVDYLDAEVVERKKPGDHSAKNGHNLNTLTSALTIILTVIGCLIIFLWVWFFVFNHRPTTIFTAEISKIGTNDEEFFAEINQLRGKTGTGETMNELKLTYYTSEDMTSKFSTGIQVLGKITTREKVLSGIFDLNQNFKHEFHAGCRAYFYNMDPNGHSYTALEKISEADYYIVEIEKKIYKLEFNNNILSTENVFWMKQHLLSDPVTLFESMVEAANSLPTGDCVIRFPLGNFFDISELNKEGRFDKLNVETKNKLYVNVKVHIEDRGVVNHVQSVFGNIAKDPNYNTDNIADKEYWKTTPNLKLTNKDFEPARDGYLSLKKSLINYTAYNTNLEVSINLDLSKFSETIKGFDYYGLYGIDLTEIKISAPKYQTFEILNWALKDTGVNANQIVTTNVKIVEVA